MWPTKRSIENLYNFKKKKVRIALKADDHIDPLNNTRTDSVSTLLET